MLGFRVLLGKPDRRENPVNQDPPDLREKRGTRVMRGYLGTMERRAQRVTEDLRVYLVPLQMVPRNSWSSLGESPENLGLRAYRETRANPDPRETRDSLDLTVYLDQLDHLENLGQREIAVYQETLEYR